MSFNKLHQYVIESISNFLWFLVAVRQKFIHNEKKNIYSFRYFAIPYTFWYFPYDQSFTWTMVATVKWHGEINKMIWFLLYHKSISYIYECVRRQKVNWNCASPDNVKWSLLCFFHKNLKLTKIVQKNSTPINLTFRFPAKFEIFKRLSIIFMKQIDSLNFILY